LLIWVVPTFLTGQKLSTKPTAGELIETIIKNTHAALIPNTVDVIKEGSPETPVTGIVTCMFATMEVLKKAVANNCNLIIAHEPLYYNHLDKTDNFQSDSVFLTKKKFINDHQLVVWRFHDYIHSIEPDGIISGMVDRLGWAKNKVAGNPFKFSFPQITLLQLLQNLKKTFPKNTVNVVGDRSLKVTGVMLVPGASGTQAHIESLQDSSIQVVVAGEVPQWETYEYVRDAVLQGRHKAIVFIGHINSEESGMKFCAGWLKKFIRNIPIRFVECGSSYWTY
jgi:putative NIF3 family GTP cyclohydrolase 1 type 2